MHIILSAVIFCDFLLTCLLYGTECIRHPASTSPPTHTHAQTHTHSLIGDSLLGHALLVIGSIPLEDCILSDKR